MTEKCIFTLENVDYFLYVGVRFLFEFVMSYLIFLGHALQEKKRVCDVFIVFLHGYEYLMVITGVADIYLLSEVFNCFVERFHAFWT